MNNDPDLSNSGYQIDQILGGRYRILSVLGKGGMGIVLRVEQIFIGKEFALKTIDKNLLSDVTIRRFQQEAKATFAVSHPNIISVNDFGLLDDETPFMVMEIVSGKTLSTRLKETTSLPIEEAIPIFIQVCFGLAHAHESGIVHRDIKPSNIMLPDPKQTPPGAVKILDFGIAKFTQDGGESQALTKTGEIFGSPLYMSPEQCSGSNVDHRSDVYSLGCVLFETLTGTPPFIGETALSTMMKHQNAPTPTLKEGSMGGEFPKDLERIVQAMLAKNPNDRYQNLGRAAHDLALIVKGENSVYTDDQIKISAPQIKREQKTITIRKDAFVFAIIITCLFSSLVTAALVAYLMPPPNDEDQPSKPDIIDTKIPKDLNLFDKKIAQKACRFELKVEATDRSMEAFKGYIDAQDITLEGCNVTDKGISYLKNSKILQLSITDCNLNSVDSIVQLPYLQNLNLANTKIDDTCLAKLKQLKMLNYISLEGTKVTEKGILQLAAINSLATLDLTKDHFSEAAIERMKEKLPFCHFVSYGGLSKMVEIQKSSKIKDLSAKILHLYSIGQQVAPNNYGMHVYLNILGDEALKNGKAADAERYYKQAEEIVEKNGNLVGVREALLQKLNFARAFKRNELIPTSADRAAQLLYDTKFHDDPDLALKLFGLSTYDRPFKDADQVAGYCQSAIDLINQFPKQQDSKLLTFLYEKAGWTYYVARNFPKALPYFQKNVTLLRHETPRNDLLYARALLELGHTLPEFSARKSAYDEGMELLEKLKFPEDYNLKEHYCDACSTLHDKYVAEGNYEEAVKYLKKAIECLREMKHPDVFNRAAQFKELLHNESKMIKKTNAH